MKNMILIFISILIILNSSLFINNCTCQWVQMSNGMGNDKVVLSLTTSGNNILAGTDDYGIWRSTNYGQEWTQTSLNNKTVWSFLISGNNILAGTDNGIFISNDNGQSWSQMALNNETVLSFAMSENNIFAGAYGVYLSTNSGQSWSQTSLNNKPILSLAISGNIIFAGTSDNSSPSGIWLSTNNGQNWTQTSLNNKNISSLAIIGNNIFAGTTDYPNPNGIYRSTNNGQNWTQTALNNQDIRSLFIYENIILAGTYYGGIWLSTNNGQNWTQKNEGLTNPFVRPLFITNNYIFAGTYGNSVWRRPLSDLIGIQNYAVSGIVRYADNNQPVTGGYVKALKLHINTLELETVDSTGILPDGTYSLPNVRIDSVYIRPYPNSTPIVDFIPTFYPSSINWETATKLYVNSNLTNINVGVIRTNVTQSQGLISGTVFKQQKTGLNEALVYAKLNNIIKGFAISGNDGHYIINNIQAGTYNIITNRPGYYSNSTIVTATGGTMSNINFTLLPYYTSVKNISAEVPDKYQLYQNYPNPFNSMTNIKFQMSNAGFAKLIVFDLLGRVVAILVNEKLKPGKYEVMFDAENLASGIYFYRLQTDTYTETRRMILVK
ncbi:MAG: carboxypeptidase regulatory-like domain-containing protein [Ignavibacteria bacterium]|nr:carboxypeptidase regulatory-like domain-containing protein [Ignavibacteria bacterium]